MALATVLGIQALLVAVAVVLLRPGTDDLATRIVGTRIGRGDLRLVGGIVVGAAVVLVTAVTLFVGPLQALPLLMVSAAAAAAAEALTRHVARPGVQARLMRRLERTLLRTEDLGRAGGQQATRLGRDVTSLARRAGGARAARRR